MMCPLMHRLVKDIGGIPGERPRELERRADFVNQGFPYGSDCDSTSLEVDYGRMSI
jgi:hypothetical protein